MKLPRSLGKKLIPAVTASRLHYGDVSIPLSNPTALAALLGRVWRLQRMTLLSLQGTLTLHPQLPNVKQELLLLKLQWQPQPVLSFCQTVTFSICLFSIRYLRHGQWDRTSLLEAVGVPGPSARLHPSTAAALSLLVRTAWIRYGPASLGVSEPPSPEGPVCPRAVFMHRLFKIFIGI